MQMDRNEKLIQKSGIVEGQELTDEDLYRKDILDLMLKFIREICNWTIEFLPGRTYPLGWLFISFITFVVIIYLIGHAIGLFGNHKGGDD